MEELLKKITKLYFQYGIKSVTMDDLAQKIGISKKTLYVHFKDKDDLVDKVIMYHIQNHRCDMEFLEIKSKNAIDRLFTVSEFLIDHIRKINPSVNYDLMKYYPKTWQKYINYQNDSIYKSIKDNIDKGIEEGLYRNDFNVEIIAKLYVWRLDFSLEVEWAVQKAYSLDDIIDNLFVYHIRGIASKKGLVYLEKKIKENIFN